MEDKEAKNTIQPVGVSPKNHSSRVEKESDDVDDEFLSAPKIPTSLNEELTELIKDHPNKLIGCGG